MKYTLSIFGAFFLFLFIVPYAYAIIFLPALALIPIAHIVAVVMGGLSIPVVGIGTLWGKLFGVSLRKILVRIVVGLCLLAVFIIIALKVLNPNRPLF